MVDFLLPTAYAEVAKRSENKDELLKAGSKLIRKRGHAFQVRRLLHTHTTCAYAYANEAMPSK